jgi:D-glycero-D-manno-heptose 1,7-bisphosphate phosphatase
MIRFSGWTLFLDRDGVINRRLPGDYVKTWPQFEFLPGVLTAIAGFSTLFKRIIVVTNQQGIGKGLMNEVQLAGIHGRLKETVEAAGGRIDAVYFCPHLAADNCTCRKPNPGMALQAQADFPEIDFSRSVMAGDTASDIQFGLNLGMITVCIGEEDTAPTTPHYRFNSLADMAKTWLTL